jgi:hypothetical protein
MNLARTEMSTSWKFIVIKFPEAPVLDTSARAAGASHKTRVKTKSAVNNRFIQSSGERVWHRPSYTEYETIRNPSPGTGRCAVLRKRKGFGMMGTVWAAGPTGDGRADREPRVFCNCPPRDPVNPEKCGSSF